MQRLAVYNVAEAFYPHSANPVNRPKFPPVSTAPLHPPTPLRGWGCNGALT